LNLLFLKEEEKEEKLHYYQGLHDIVSIFLLVLGPNTALKATKKIIKEKLNVKLIILIFKKSFMQKDLEPILKYLNIIHIIILKEDKELGELLNSLNLNETHYSISWVLTWVLNLTHISIVFK
jgi:hypothetical protein